MATSSISYEEFLEEKILSNMIGKIISEEVDQWEDNIQGETNHFCQSVEIFNGLKQRVFAVLKCIILSPNTG